LASRKPARRRLQWLWWTLAVFAFLTGLLTAGEAATYPGELGRQPVRATAKATSIGIDGFGGDPYVDYRYTVNGHT
jgi:hypothetical protein